MTNGWAAMLDWSTDSWIFICWNHFCFTFLFSMYFSLIYNSLAAAADVKYSICYLSVIELCLLKYWQKYRPFLFFSLCLSPPTFVCREFLFTSSINIDGYSFSVIHTLVIFDLLVWMVEKDTLCAILQTQT